MQLVSKTVKELKIIFTGWRAALKTEEDLNGYKQSLLLALMSQGIDSMEMIDRGLKRAESESIHRDFMPPANRFAFWCKPQPEDFGLMCVDDACRAATVEAGKHPEIRQWPHEVVYKAASEFGVQRLSELSQDKALKEFTRVYQSVCARYVGGDRFVIPESKQIEHHPLSKAEKSERMQGLMAGMGW